MYTVEQISNSFVIKRDGIPLFGGASIDYYIKKEDLFNLSVISLIHPKDKFTLSLKDMDKTDISEMYIDVVESVYGEEAADDIRNLNSPNKFYINSIGKVFIMAKYDVPYFCGPRNSVIIRTDAQEVYVYNRYSLDLIQQLKLEETGSVDIVSLYEEIIDHADDPVDSRGLNYIGAWNASTNTPDFSLIEHVNGDYYKVSVAGNIDIDGTTDWNSGDWILYNGLIWEKIDQSETISSVNGEIGLVVLNPDHLDDTSTTNKFTTQTEKDKLTAIENSATADQTDAEIKAAYENNANTNVFDNIKKTKLDNIEDNAEANNILDANANSLVSGLESVLHKHDYDKLLNLPVLPTDITDLTGTLDNIPNGTTHVKSTNDYTTADKDKLAGLESSKFLGLYIDLVSLQAAHPAPIIGSYAHVDAGVGVDTKVYIWDNNDTQYVEQVGTVATETTESIKTKYESNTNTNAFDDAYKTKLDGIETGASAGDGHTALDQVVTDLAGGTQNGIIVAINNAFQLITIEEFLNSIPRIVSTPNKTEIYAADTFCYQVDATGINLLYSLSNFPTGMTISATGHIDYVGIDGIYTNIVIEVSNGYGSATQNIDITVVGDQQGSKINHLSMIDKMIGENYFSSGDWKNQLGVNILKNNIVSTRPNLVTEYVNGKSAVYFDGDDDYLLEDGLYHNDVGSVIMLFCPNMVDGQYGQLFGNFIPGQTITLNHLNNDFSFSFDGNSTNKSKYTLDGTNYSTLQQDTNIYPWVNNTWNKIYVEFETVQHIEYLSIGSLYPDFPVGVYQYKGYIALMVTYDSALTQTQVTESFNWIYEEYGI